MPAHFQHEHRGGQSQANPETPLHVGEFGVGCRFGGDRHGLQCHAADRTTAGTDLADLRMHRAGEDRAGGRASGFLGREVLSGSAANFVRQPAQQKWNVVAVVLTWRWRRCRPGSTVMPQTGSVTPARRPAASMSRQCLGGWLPRGGGAFGLFRWFASYARASRGWRYIYPTRVW